MSWIEWFEEAAAALDRAIRHQARLWLTEQVLSEGYREAVAKTAIARSRWEERLTAYNAYKEWSSR